MIYSPRESQLFITQSSFSGSRSIDLSENNFESLFADADKEIAVDNFNLRTEDLTYPPCILTHNPLAFKLAVH